MIGQEVIEKSAKIITGNTTLHLHDFTSEGALVLTASGKTITLPTPSRKYLGQKSLAINATSGSNTIACTGGILGGDSFTLTAYTGVSIECIKYGSTFKWFIGGREAAVIGDLSETIADTVGAMFSGNTETGITVTYQDADNTIDLVLAAGLGSSIDWADFTPVATWDTAPASVTMVARKRRIANAIEFVIDLSGADGDARTLSYITLPDAPVDINARIYCPSGQYVADNTPTDTNPLAYIDAETNLGRIMFPAIVPCVNNKAWRISVSGRYEVAA